MKFDELCESIINEAVHPDLKRLLTVRGGNGIYEIVALPFSYSVTPISKKLEQDLKDFKANAKTKSIKKFFDDLSWNTKDKILPPGVIKFLVQWLTKNDPKNDWLKKYNELKGLKDERSSVKEVKNTQLYTDLQDLLRYLKFNYKTYVGPNYYGEEQDRIKMAPLYKKWHDILVELMRAGKTDIAKNEIEAGLKAKRSNYGNIMRDFVAGIAYGDQYKYGKFTKLRDYLK